MGKSIAFMRKQCDRAYARYHACYDNDLYTKAIHGKNNPIYANLLTDEALALCGHPHHKLSDRNWSKGALEFLALFSK